MNINMNKALVRGVPTSSNGAPPESRQRSISIGTCPTLEQSDQVVNTLRQALPTYKQIGNNPYRHKFMGKNMIYSLIICCLSFKLMTTREHRHFPCQVLLVCRSIKPSCPIRAVAAPRRPATRLVVTPSRC